MPVPDGVRDEVRASLLKLRKDLIAVGNQHRVGLVDMLTEFCLIGKGEMVTTIRQANADKKKETPPIAVAPSAPLAARNGSFLRHPSRGSEPADLASQPPSSGQSHPSDPSGRPPLSPMAASFDEVTHPEDASALLDVSGCDSERGASRSASPAAPEVPNWAPVATASSDTAQPPSDVHSLRTPTDTLHSPEALVPKAVAFEALAEPPVRRGSHQRSLSQRYVSSFNRYFEALRGAHVREVFEKSTFGVELEMFVCKPMSELEMHTDEKAKNDFCPFLNESLADHDIAFTFFDCATSKSDRLYTKWKVTTDSSIQAEDGRPMFGFEIVSPKLRGWDGLQHLWHVADAARGYGCATNNTTALHVHVSCEAFSNVQVKNIMLWYLYFEAVIDRFHSFPRRNDDSKYCRSMVKSVLQQGDSGGHRPVYSGTPADCLQAVSVLKNYDVSFSQGFEGFLSAFNPRLGAKAKSGRNHKLNSTLLKGTGPGDPVRRIEWRQHAGTCDSQEIMMWTKFCTLFTHMTAETEAPLPTVEATPAALWDFLRDSSLASYYTLKESALPPAPPGFAGIPREAVAAETAVRRTSRTGRTLMQAMVQQHFGLTNSNSTGALLGSS
eukprot:TRINITY_DN7159_c0_g1_i1.p1 TRINITY_DN7159_c0_g1~~TRINITY_DN7159_c0_g1_i1.p1  ORF type:complete len:610 (+),score=149.88 TRINITY_DN7159_c0_g1_i1:137-1966(+)